MNPLELVQNWFDCWTSGDFHQLPITDDFRHTSPYGTIKGKEAYIKLVEANREKFLGHQFNIHDTMADTDKACVRYTAVKGDFRLEVTEWHYTKHGAIHEIIAYYNIEGEIKEERKLEIPD